MQRKLWVGEPVESAKLGFSDDLWRIIDEVGGPGLDEPHYRNLGPDAASWLAALVISENIQYAVELGTSNGYSSLYIGGALSKTGGHLWTYEKYTERAELANTALGRAGLSSTVSVEIADGISELIKHSDPIDLLFMDIWPADYIAAFTNAQDRLHTGSIIAADNMNSHRGRDGTVCSAAGSGASEYREFIRKQASWSTTQLELGSGLLVAQLD